MTKILFNYLIGIASLLFVVSCSSNKVDEVMKYIPAKSLIAGCIDLHKLEKKGAIKEIQELKNNDSAFLKKINYLINTLKESGADVSKLYFAQDLDNGIIGLAAIDNIEKVKEMATNNIGGVVVDGDVTAAVNDQLKMAWNKEVVIFGFRPHFENSDNAQDAIALSTSDNDVSNLLKLFGKENRKSNITTLDGFKNVFDHSYDLCIWMGMGKEFFERISNDSQIPANFIKKDMFLNSSVAVQVNFEKGKLEGNVINFLSEFFQKAIKNAKPDEIDKSFVNSLNLQNPVALVALSVNPDLVMTVLNEMGFGGMIDMYLGSKQTSLKELMNVLEGNVVMGIDENNSSNVLFKIKLKDPVKAREIIHKAFGDIVSMNGNNLEMSGYFGLISSDALTISSNSSLLPPGKLNLSSQVSNHLCEKQGGVYVDFSRHSVDQDSNNLSGIFNQLLFYLNDWDGEKSNAHFEISMVDKNMNALTQIIQRILNKNDSKHVIEEDELIAESQSSN